ncbi:glycosyltransferase family 4 protein [Spirosoma rhododendri]|uniref:Glycosyltransferase family 4 protein n=1 Tax=Spirosoma rhododendri TaxID=2728024 RepID=A0A7L5DNA2_9BACT|nr:glycosyltransferase family 4 protein [Spirosoma rhododendri]QJD77230.1 glycosyltransferase family 4 protein [Spirosoma rhododendri]
MLDSRPFTAVSAPPDWLIPLDTAERVLTVGPDHINYRGGIGSVMNVYARHFATYKCITTHRVMGKGQLILFFLRQYLRFIQTLLRDPAIDIVHIQASSHGSFYRKLVLFLTARYAFRKRTIYHMHGSRFVEFYEQSGPLSQRLIRFLVERADIVIVLSEYWRDYFNRQFRVRRLEILSNIIHQRDLSAGFPTRPAGKLPVRLLFLGAIGQRKGIFDLLDGIQQYRDSFEGRLLLYVGGNGDTKRLESYIAQHRLESIVRFEGWVSGIRKHELLSTCDVFILPSYNEGLPLSILEAMNYHLPIIATPVGGTAEVVHDGVNGFLVTPGDKKTLCQRLMRFIDDPDLVNQMGDESARLIAGYQPEVVLPRLNQLYNDLLTKKPD